MKVEVVEAVVVDEEVVDKGVFDVVQVVMEDDVVAVVVDADVLVDVDCVSDHRKARRGRCGRRCRC